jgi:hypothetical protein
MNPIRTIRHLAYILAALATAAAALTATAPAALAMIPLPPGNPRTHAQAQMHAITTTGMPGWQITLIAAGAALLTATAAVLTDRALAARRRAALSPA